MLPTSLADALSGLPAYALVDPALCPEALRHRSAVGARYMLAAEGVSATDEAAQSVMPFLLPLSDEAEKRRRQFSTFEGWALESHSVSWLSSPLPPELLRVQLGRRLDVMLSDDQPALLRMSDTRILPVLNSVLDDAQRKLFFTPVSQWWYFDRDEALTCIASSSVTGIDLWQTPWRLSAAQEAALLTAAEPDTVIAMLHEHSPNEMQKLPRPQRHGFIRDQMNQAKTWGLHSAQQQALYCMVALNLGASFSELPTWQAALTQVRDKRMSMTDAISTVESGRT